MEKFVITGGKPLKGTTSVSGSKNVALKAVVAACLTSDEVIVKNVPLISDFFVMSEIVKELGGSVEVSGHTAKIRLKEFKTNEVSLDTGGRIRTSAMFLAPLLARQGEAIVPNPGGCRIGARPIDRTVEGLRQMGVEIAYLSDDGFFHAKVKGRLKGTTYRFEKNSHTGTETLLLSAVLAEGRTILENAAEEPEVNQLIALLNEMGADVTRTDKRTLVINGVSKLHGVTFTISPDRNEMVTLAIAAVLTEGDIVIKGASASALTYFLEKFEEAGGGFKEEKDGLRFFYKGSLKAVDIVTAAHPGFMTDWQSPWAVLMTKAQGTSIVHEAVYEYRFGYVSELNKMGADITLFNPVVKNKESFYNFNVEDDKKGYMHAAKIQGPTALHNAIVTISDLRAGATLVLAALCATGKTVIFGIEHLDRGYEHLEKRLKSLGANVERLKD